MLSAIILGLISGATFGLAGVGLVVTYKTSGVFNFAHGAIATVSCYLFYSLHSDHGMHWALAAIICVFVLPIPMSLVLEYVGRSLARAGLAAQVVATIGMTLIVQSGIDLYYGTEESRSVDVFMPIGSKEIGGAFVTYEQMIFCGIAAGATLLLYLFFKLSRLGVAMRGIVDDPGLLSLAGTDPVRVRRAGWLIGVSFASLSGVLLSTSPEQSTLNSAALTLAVTAAFGAAALGGFTSLPLTFAGGLAIGALRDVCTYQFPTGDLARLPVAIPYLVLFAVLLVFPRRYLLDKARLSARDSIGWSAPWQVQVVGGLVLVGFLATVPEFADVRLGVWTQTVASIIVFLSLGLLTRLSGQVSLCHMSFMAIGTATLAQLTTNHGVPWFLALVLAGLVAVPIGAVLAIPAMRLTGLYLALATFGFGVILQAIFYSQDYMFGATGIDVSRPPGLDGGREFYYFVLAVAVTVGLFVVALARSRLGRLLRGMAGSPTAMTTAGTSLNVTRTLVFCLSAFLAAIGGALFSLSLSSETRVSTTGFPTFQSLIFLVVVVISLGREPWYAPMAAAMVYLIPSYVTSAETTRWLNLIFGLTAVVFVMLPPRAFEVPLPIRNGLDKLCRRTGPPGGAGDETAPTIPAQRVSEGALAVEQVTVAFGGNIAVKEFSLTARTGVITGLIGPNGAGKTTTFNAASGLVRPRSGNVSIDGRSVTRTGVAARARKGLGRTFQRMELVDAMTVRDNVAIGWEGSRAAWNPFAHLVALPSEKRAMRAATDAAIALCDLGSVVDTPVGTLSTGQRRLVELARCLAGPFRVLLLDEPSSGLDKVETARFAEILRRVVAERGVGILLVEHDMSLVMDVCEYIYVLDFGVPLLDGTPAMVRASAAVRAAYLGDDDTPEMLAAEASALAAEVSS